MLGKPRALLVKQGTLFVDEPVVHCQMEPDGVGVECRQRAWIPNEDRLIAEVAVLHVPSGSAVSL